MKKLITAAASIILISTAIFADENSDSEKSEKPKYETKTLIPSSSNLTFSGYGAPTVGFSQISDTWVTTTGFRGGLIINGKNHGMVIGLAGEGVAYPTESHAITGETYPDERDHISLGWGGLLLEYHFMPRSLVHFSLGTTIGAGGIDFYDGGNDEDTDHSVDSFFVVEPEIAAYINITKFFRIGAAASYRYAYGINTDGLSDSDFNNFGGKLLFEFGWF